MLSLALLILLSTALCAQQLTKRPVCYLPGDSDYIRSAMYRTTRSATSTSIVKVIRVNIHFMLHTNGTGNFTETDDGDGRSYTGYDFAHDHINDMNARASWNEQMNIPPGNTTPVNDKNFRFVLNGVYFHRNNTYYNYPASPHALYGVDIDSVMNVYLNADPNPDPNNPGCGGYAGTINPSNHSSMYTEDFGYWHRYLYVYNFSSPMSWFFHATSQQTGHEMGHLFGLLHTVLYSNGARCPTACNLPIDLNCDDGCGDTPTAWDIMALHSNCNLHPACSWGDGYTAYCTNNLMDYTGGNALSPCQINKIHYNIETGEKSYTACAAVNPNRSYCDIGYPISTYFGNAIQIGTCGSTPANITSKENIAVWYAQSVELGAFEVASDASFEVLQYEVCTF
jgi:hypothetical protein